MHLIISMFWFGVFIAVALLIVRIVIWLCMMALIFIISVISWIFDKIKGE